MSKVGVPISKGDDGGRAQYFNLALAAMHARGTHRVAPWRLTEAMREASSDEYVNKNWHSMRTAYLAESKA